MNSNIFIPLKIKVGFQNRNDTFTQKLAYVTYFGPRGDLRKEGSWNSWRNSSIEPIEYTNEPRSGFVLNKVVGDSDTGWNHRRGYIRIYDPRGFEFEITFINLLYILENTNSTKGGNLEGNFVYAWDGTELILMPTESPDYVSLVDYSKKLISKTHVTGSNLTPGIKYKSTDGLEWIYMGRFNYYTIGSQHVQVGTDNLGRPRYEYQQTNTDKGLYYFFMRQYKSWGDELRNQTLILRSVGSRFVEPMSEEQDPLFTQLFEALESNPNYSPYDPRQDTYVYYSYQEFKEVNDPNRTSFYSYMNIYDSGYNHHSFSYDRSTGRYKETDYSLTYSSRSTDVGTLDDIFDKYQPMYLNKYLANGKLYKTER
jgi:hypothetical protein